MSVKRLKRYVCFCFIFCSFVLMPSLANSKWKTASVEKEKQPGKISFLYGDRELAPEAVGMTRAWGFVPLIHFDDKTILFNAGGDRNVLKHNMKIRNVDPSKIDILVISHEHWDMYRGTDYILEVNPDLEIYTTPKVKSILIKQNKKWEKNIHMVDRRVMITPNIFLYEMKSKPRHGGPFGILSISVILKTKDGLVVLDACGHVNIVDILREATHLAHESIINMYIGGTHLLPPWKKVDLPNNGGKATIPQDFDYSDEYIRKLANKLKNIGLEKIIPTHCTGEHAEKLFAEIFKTGYVNQRLGMTLQIAAPIR